MFCTDSRFMYAVLHYAILQQFEKPFTQTGGTDKSRLPLVQMSKAFMKIPNVIQHDPTNKELLYFAQTQSDSL